MRDTQTDLQGVAPQNDNVHASHRSSAAVQRGDGKQERPWVPLESQSGIPACRSAAVGTNLNKNKKKLSIRWPWTCPECHSAFPPWHHVTKWVLTMDGCLTALIMDLSNSSFCSTFNMRDSGASRGEQASWDPTSWAP